MRAYVLVGYGGPAGSMLMDVPSPAIGSAEILVDVRAAGLNPIDFKFREGMLRKTFLPKLPFVLGNELAGEVIAVGSEANRFCVGDRVFARVAKDRAGAFAELACVDETYAANIPVGLDFTTAAAVPLAGLTALQAVRDELDVKPGQRVFISGGAGGVGTFAIQIAKWLGAHVTTSASKDGEALVRSLGCDEVIDYTAQEITSAGRTFDAGLDLIGGKTLEQMFEIVKPGAKIVSTVGSSEPQTATNANYCAMSMHPSGGELAQLGKLMEEGKLKVILDKAFLFSEISAGLAYLERGHAKGKVVVVMGNRAEHP